jgi:hypothetical protein
MFNFVRKISQNTIFINIFSLILTINLWLILANYININRWIEAKIIVYNIKEDKKLSYPTNIKILVKGPKLAFYIMDYQNNIVYINYNNLKDGQNMYKIDENDIFLSNTKLDIVNYYPESINIEIL